VSSRRLIPLLALALGVQIAYADPRVAAAEVRAMACCARHCDEPLSLPSARGCCRLTVGASGPAEAPIAPCVPSFQAATFAAPVAASVLSASTEARPDAWPAAGSGPPPFLSHRHLLL
jgi:hypothetical protein